MPAAAAALAGGSGADSKSVAAPVTPAGNDEADWAADASDAEEDDEATLDEEEARGHFRRRLLPRHCSAAIRLAMVTKAIRGHSSQRVMLSHVLSRPCPALPRVELLLGRCLPAASVCRPPQASPVPPLLWRVQPSFLPAQGNASAWVSGVDEPACILGTRRRRALRVRRPTPAPQRRRALQTTPTCRWSS